MEHLGHPVYITEGSYTNIKVTSPLSLRLDIHFFIATMPLSPFFWICQFQVTTPDDILLAERILNTKAAVAATWSFGYKNKCAKLPMRWIFTHKVKLSNLPVILRCLMSNDPCCKGLYVLLIKEWREVWVNEWFSLFCGYILKRKLWIEFQNYKFRLISYISYIFAFSLNIQL